MASECIQQFYNKDSFEKMHYATCTFVWDTCHSQEKLFPVHMILVGVASLASAACKELKNHLGYKIILYSAIKYNSSSKVSLDRQ